MSTDDKRNKIYNLRNLYPEKFADEKTIFGHIHRGNKILIGTACGEPRYLVKSFMEYIRNNPKAFFDAEILHVWTLDAAPLC